MSNTIPTWWLVSWDLIWPIGGELVTTITSPSCWRTHFLYLSKPPSGNLLPIIPWPGVHLHFFVSSLLKCRNVNSINNETCQARVRWGHPCCVYINIMRRVYWTYVSTVRISRGLNRYKLELQTNHRRRFHTRLLLGPSPGLKQLPALSHLKHYQDAMS